MGQDNAVPRRINRAEGAAGQVIISGGPGVCESWGAAGALQSKAEGRNIDLAAASGDAAYTGVGFKPTAIIFFCLKAGSTDESVNFCDQGLTMMGGTWEVDTAHWKAWSAMRFHQTGTDYKEGTVKSFDVDGFTITWTKVGNPVGTGRFTGICLR